MTPPEILKYPESGPWQIRFVENLFPVLGDDSNPGGYSFGLQQTIDGYGRHEVIIDHDNHGIRVHEMEEQHIRDLFRLFRRRMQDLYYGDPRLRYVLFFKNFGPAAGGSIPHTHSQLIATPVVPENVHAEVINSGNFYEKHCRCIFCSLIDEALTFETTIYNRESGQVRRRIGVGQYVVERGDKFIAIKPFASMYEWEVHILPLEHAPDFSLIGDECLEDLARVLKRVMARLEKVVGGVQYNYFLHTLPHGEAYEGYEDSYHWHLEICPRTSIPTGFELGSGYFVNTVSPESAARQLREARIDEA